jgi:hypothetical protein
MCFSIGNNEYHALLFPEKKERSIKINWALNSDKAFLEIGIHLSNKKAAKKRRPIASKLWFPINWFRDYYKQSVVVC